VVFGAGLAAIGAAAVVTGSVMWNRAGELTDCVVVDTATNKTICREEYRGKGLGIGIVVGGALLAGVGGYLMLFTNTQVVAGPGGVAVAGRF